MYHDERVRGCSEEGVNKHLQGGVREVVGVNSKWFLNCSCDALHIIKTLFFWLNGDFDNIVAVQRVNDTPLV